MKQEVSVQGYPVSRGPHIPRRIQGLQALGQWKQQDADAPDAWLRVEISTAFQQMVCLNLGATPSVEMLPLTAEMWVITVGDGMIEEIDRDRIKAGFRQLFRKLKWWPQPGDLLQNLPPRPQRTALPAPAISDEEHAAQAQKLQDIMDMLNGNRGVNNNGL